MKWFTRSPVERISQPTKPVKYPMWTFLHTEKGFYLILEKTKMQFISDRAFWSWSRPCLVSNELAVSKYLNAGSIGFAPGTLVISQADKTEYYITGSNVLSAERRLITTPDFYTDLGFDRRNAFVISLSELDHHKRGEDITEI